MLEKDQPVRDGVWTSAEIELINEKVLPPFPFSLDYLLGLVANDERYNP
jgi:obg-like ATPase 1